MKKLAVPAAVAALLAAGLFMGSPMLKTSVRKSARQVDASLMSSPASAPVEEATLEAAGPQDLRLRIVQYAGGATLAPAVDPSGAAMSLSDIYGAANLNVVLEPQTAVPYPLGGDRPKPEELHQLASGPMPAAAGAGWHVTMFLLKKGPVAGDLGVMFAESTRDRFAVFALEMNNAPAQVLRTTAHELGHVLNLFHNDGDGDFDCCAGDNKPKVGKTLMNRDACLAATWRYGFSAAEREHLLRHPLKYVQPNSGVKFGDCVAGHRKTC